MILKDLENYFSNKENIKDNIKLSDCETVINGESFVKASIDTLKNNSGNKYFIGDWERLVKYYNKIRG